MNLKEEDIRKYIEDWFQQKGISTEREVACGNGVRADLVTSDTVIEVKKQLNRGAIYQAYGQGVAYQTLLKKPKLMIIGLAPSSEARYQEAERIAENVRNANVEVVFIDKDPKWGVVKAAIIAQASLPSDLQPLDKPPPKSKPTVQLPFEVAAASTDGGAEQATAKASTKASSGGSSFDSGKQADKPARKSTDSQDSNQPAVLVWKDVWKLLLIILLFLWIRAYLWQMNSPQNSLQNNQDSLPLDASPQPDPPPTPFTIPSVPQK